MPPLNQIPTATDGSASATRIAPPTVGTMKKAEDKPKRKPFITNEKTVRFNEKEQIKFYRGMGSMLRAQINTGDAIKYYAHGVTNPLLADKISSIQTNIASGIPIHEAFRKTELFDNTTIGLIQAGTDSGQLHEAFAAISHRIKTAREFKVKVRKAVAIPLAVIGILVFAFIMSQVKIVPQVEGMLKGARQEPDAFTRLVFHMSHFTQAVWPFFVLGIIVFILAIVFSNKLRNVITTLAMSRWRLLRSLIMGLRQMTFLGTMHMLHSNGINLAKSISTAAKSVKGTPMHDELLVAAEKYQETGLPVSEAFRKYTSCDPQVGHMLFIGERSASIDTQLKMLAEMYEEDTRAATEDFTQTLGFIVMIIAVILIATVFIGTFMPIFMMGPKMMKSGI